MEQRIFSNIKKIYYIIQKTVLLMIICNKKVTSKNCYLLEFLKLWLLVSKKIIKSLLKYLFSKTKANS